MKKHNFQTTIFQQDDILDVIDNIENSISSTVLPSLKDLKANVGDRDILATNVLFSNLKLKDDAELFTRIEKIVTKYSAIISSLRKKVIDELPDTMTANTSNINIKLTFSLISEGLFLSTELIPTLSYLINKYYLKETTELDSGTNNYLGKKVVILSKIIPELEKAKFEEIVNVIGNVPTIKTLREEDRSIIPVELVNDFITSNFKIKEFYTVNLLKRLTGVFNFNKDSGSHKDIAKSFIGNPIMHIRLFLIDLQSLRLEKYRDEVKLLEFRLLELKNNNDGRDDKSIAKAIKYYEEKINKLNLKIDKLSKID